jgi:hypothetical protein
MRRAILQPILGLVFIFWAQAGFAADGVVEMNQACIAAGCFAGDDPGFPIEIRNEGSYILTGNLQVADPDTTAVVVFASNVSIDLNGFTIQGVTECTGEPAVCSNTGTGRGISADVASLPRGLTVSNGHIVGMGSIGILGIGSANFSDLHVSQCGAIGIFSAADSHFTRVNATFNGADGIQAQFNITISDTRAAHNGGTGIYVQYDSVISDSKAYANGNSGIVVSSGSVVHDSSSVSNAGTGFFGGEGVVFRGNTSLSNTFGFAVDVGSLLESNVARGNSQYGVQLSADTVYRGNSFTNNTNGPLSPISPGVNGGENYCSGPNTVMASCP